MSTLITLDNVSLAFGHKPLLDHVKLNIQSGERVCLIGRNGAGKSTLLKLLSGKLQPDDGSIWRKPHLSIGELSQELPQETALTIYEFVAEGLQKTGKILTQYHALLQKLSGEHTPADLNQLERLQHQIDACDGWQFEQKIETVLTRLNLPADKQLNTLSGGWQRRVALAKAFVRSPDLLLLDEPTNHLDIETIQWLEDQLVTSGMGLLFITHDRALLRRLATRIIELDRGNLTSWPGDYDNYLRRKEERTHAEEKQQVLFDKKLVQEEIWIRQGIKARRTRNEGRVRALKALRLERSKRREQEKKASFKLNEKEQSGKLVIEASHVFHYFADKPVIKDFSIRIQRKDRIGLIGPNGVGKTTLLNILLGKLQPQKGTVKQGTKLQIAYFDQLRESLDPEKTVRDNLNLGSDEVEIEGKKRHVMSYLSDFLFTPDRAMTPVKALSGGECNRLLLARLFIKPANFLVLDEPTNDLDIETLELLEELLANYSGTLLLVSHDRAFLDNVVTSVLVFEGEGKIIEYVGGYQDWKNQTKAQLPEKNIKEKTTSSKVKQSEKKKLTFKEQEMLKALPKKIEQLEADIAVIQAKMSKNNFYQQSPEKISQTTQHLKKLEFDLQAAYTQWEELESIQGE